ncbi:NAD+ nucleosidase [Fasciola gigantica]|uniref:NAD+ nucleosidase n=1 Tax=Fasciola gigantica TaxID=46835 RepID=A0A504YMY5_FASGI|nr:NAD+ nucleosidase [Fasciola gigantica]
MKHSGTGMLVSLVLSLFVACSFGQQTSDFEKITKGRCATWGRMFGVDRITCDQIWADFEKVFTGEPIKKLCVMDPQLYDPLVASMFAFVPEISKTKTCEMFFLFSSSFPLHAFALHQGFMFNDLDWCDEKLTGGKKYETQCGCTGKAEVVYAFWKSVSNAYSNKLSGSVGVMLNGSIPTPFSRNSTFGSVEVPNIKAPRFQNVTVYVLKNLEDDNLRANCFSESIVQLQTILKDQKVDYKCVDDPPFVKHFMCVQNPDHPRCAFSSSRWTSTSRLLILLSFFSSHIF